MDTTLEARLNEELNTFIDLGYMDPIGGFYRSTLEEFVKIIKTGDYWIPNDLYEYAIAKYEGRL